jgi:hypothetical protein
MDVCGFGAGFEIAQPGIFLFERQFERYCLLLCLLLSGFGFLILLLKLIDSLVGARALDAFSDDVNQDYDERRGGCDE